MSLHRLGLTYAAMGSWRQAVERFDEAATDLECRIQVDLLVLALFPGPEVGRRLRHWIHFPVSAAEARRVLLVAMPVSR